MRNVLITGARAPVAVDLARAFAAAGYAAHLADSVTPWAARLSRHVSATHRLPPPRTQFAAFADAMRDLAERLDPVAIVPTCEEVFYVAAAGLGERVLAPRLEDLRTLHSKVAFAEHARALGLAAPETWRVTDTSLPLAPEELVLKPEFSRFATHILIRPSAKDLASIDLSPARPWAAQRFVAGEELCLWSFARAGRIVAKVVYKPVWRHGKAAAYAVEAVDCPGALAIAETVAKAGNITGHLSFDLIVAPDGVVAPIECNPRAVSGLHLFDASADLARAMLGEGEARPVAGLRYLGPAMALLGPPAAIASGRVGALARDIGQGRDAVGRSGDRWPMLGAMIDAGRFAGRAVAARISAAGATTDDIEWNGEPL